MSDPERKPKQYRAPFVVRCCRCRGEQEFTDLMALNMAMQYYYELPTGIVMCPSCADSVLAVRQPHLLQARNAAIDEIDAYHESLKTVAADSVVSLVDMELPKQ